MVAAHDALVRGALLAEAGARPVLIERTDQDLMGQLFDDLAGSTNQQALRSSRVRGRGADGLPRLKLPVHRAFHFALIELVCDRPGFPRLDPMKIDSAGLVVRRVADGGGFEGWMQSKSALQGWVRLSDENADPDPARRRITGSGNPEIDRRLAALQSGAPPLEEVASPLLPVPPEICKAAGSTILAGLVPVTSSDKSEVAVPFPKYKDDDVTALLPAHLKAGPAGQIPRPEQTVTPSSADSADLKSFINVLSQVTIEFAMFGTSADSRALFAEVNTIKLEDGRRAGDFLRDASRTLLERAPGSAVTMPKRWPVLDVNQARRIRTLAAAVLDAQLQRMTGKEGRFDDLRRVYRVRAFVRVKREDGCPPKLYWSDYSDRFTISTWYDPGDQPPVVVALPDLTDREALKNLAPNVAFSMPESTFNLLQNADLKGLTDGNKPGGGLTVGLGWICSFSIPIITLCAFIVLNIFLKLFDLIFQWMLFIKICIPIPIPRKK